MGRCSTATWLDRQYPLEPHGPEYFFSMVSLRAQCGPSTSVPIFPN